MTMDTDSVRSTFLEFFAERDHRLIAGSPVVPVDDPTLLFINSGMAPLKRYFTGEDRPPATNLCNVQACIRTRDIEDVGDRHHLTSFEMLGSWSIGGYFKEHAIELAYELLVDRFGLDAKRLYATVFAGDAALGIPPDEVSAAAWERVGVPRDRIVALPAADNFWGPAGDSGPCGPCTEVFLDTGDEFGPRYTPGGEFDTSRYVEIWNAGVFMQFDKGLDGVLRPLPFTSVDTGSGLERMQMALNGYRSVYDTDLLAPVVLAAQQTLGETGPAQRHHLVIADHVRTATLILAEGVQTSNEGRGYIARRLIRKCVAVVHSRGHDTLDLRPVVDVVIDRLGKHYPHLVAAHGAVVAAVRQECVEFDRTVRRGLDRLHSLLEQRGAISGNDAFQLFATYGLPIEITRDLAAESGYEVSVSEYEKAFAEHQRLSRGSTGGSGGDGGQREVQPADVLPAYMSELPATSFVGYDTLSADATVLALFLNGGPVDVVAAGQQADLIVDSTPFYGEGGGQVGDRGELVSDSTRAEIRTTVVHKSGRYLHRLRVTEGELRVGDRVTLRLDERAREMTAANHTGTHLLNAALRQVLGEHVRQAGSLVEPQRLRFDFTHPKALTPEEIRAVETLVNDWILADESRQVELMAPQEAISHGALSLPGEEYAPEVRVVSFGSVSKELCGGTHVPHTSVIGSLRITSEQSVAAGVRRINAVTRHLALEYALDQSALLSDTAAVLGTSVKDLARASRRIAERLQRATSTRNTGGQARAENTRKLVLSDVPVVVGALSAEPAEVRAEAVRLAAESDSVAFLWAPTDRGKSVVALAVPPSQRGARNAAQIMKALAAARGGSGGGSHEIAQGGVPGPVDEKALLDALATALT